MSLSLLNAVCCIRRDEYDDNTFDCITEGRYGCPKEEDRFCLTEKCFVDILQNEGGEIVEFKVGDKVKIECVVEGNVVKVSCDDNNAWYKIELTKVSNIDGMLFTEGKRIYMAENELTKIPV